MEQISRESYMMRLENKYRRVHGFRMKRDFGIDCTFGSTPPRGSERASTSIINRVNSRFHASAETMWRIFGHDGRCTSLLEGAKRICGIKLSILATIDGIQRNPTQETNTEAKMSTNLLKTFRSELSILDAVTEGKPEARTALLDYLRLLHACIVEDETFLRDIQSYITHLSLRDETIESKLVSMIEGEIDMRVYLEHEFEAERSQLAKIRSELTGSWDNLTNHVNKLHHINAAHPNIRLLTRANEDSETTLQRLRMDFEQQQEELHNLRNVEDTLLDELHALRKTRAAYEAKLSMNDEEFANVMNQEHQQQLDIEQRNSDDVREISIQLQDARFRLANIRAQIRESFGVHSLNQMQQDCQILYAKKGLFCL